MLIQETGSHFRRHVIPGEARYDMGRTELARQGSTIYGSGPPYPGGALAW
jgi:hypothetical protein